MNENDRMTSLEQLLERLAKAADHRDQVEIGTMIEVVGQKSFGPLLLLAGVVAFSPFSGIPGVPTIVALIVLLTAGQLLFGRQYFWLPQWVMRRKVPRTKYEKALKCMQPAARFVDRFFRPRLTLLTRRAGAYVIALVCVLIALAMPPLELVPFAATTAGAALTAFGLSLISQDGVMTVVALIFTAGASILTVRTFF